MINIPEIKLKIKTRLGELWWYTIVLFFTQQIGAVINAFIGLWLVPKYVPQDELGVVLPLGSIGGLLGLPLSILMIPFMKFLSKYMAQEEYGKIKALLRDAFILAAITFLLVSGISYFCMPVVFKRLRVEAGALSVLVICSGIIGALAPVFSTALQAFKKFRILSFMGVAGAILRLGALLIALPIRGLSGYFVGQIVPSLFCIIGSMWFLRKYLSTKIHRVSYWSEDIKGILQYTGWFAVFSLFSMLVVTAESFVIRHRLSGLESAGYYMVSRFSDIVTSVGIISASVLFPIISEKHEKKIAGQRHVLLQSFGIQLVGGVLFSLIMAPLAYLFFSMNGEWNVYNQFIPYMIFLCAISIIRGMTYCYVMYEMALSRFKFVVPFALFYVLEIVVLLMVTGYSFFAPWVPSSWLTTIEAYNPCRLSVVIVIILLSTLINFGYILVKLTLRTDLNAVEKAGVS
jgi:O-antigen/teichoic acid export membrane protein